MTMWHIATCPNCGKKYKLPQGIFTTPCDCTAKDWAYRDVYLALDNLVKVGNTKEVEAAKLAKSILEDARK